MARKKLTRKQLYAELALPGLSQVRAYQLQRQELEGGAGQTGAAEDVGKLFRN